MFNTQIPSTITKESLFQLGEHFYALESLLIDQQGELDEIIDEWLEEYQAKESEKIDAYCYLIQKFQEIAEEAKRLSNRSSSYQNKAKNLKDRLKVYLERRGRDKLETSKFTITVCQNGGKQPVMVYDHVPIATFPEEYLRVYKEPDIEKLRQALYQHKVEVKTIATLMPRGTHLRIK